MDEYFNLWFGKLLEPWEGGIADRPLKDDPGGLTNRGVTIGIWKQYATKLFGIPGTEATLRQITAEQAKRIAYEIYWKAYSIDTITNPAIKILAAESVWGGGGYPSIGYRSGTFTQRANQINADNKTNPKLFDLMVQRRLSYLRSLKNYPVNARGWENRVMNGDKTRLSLVQLVQKYALNNVAAVAGISIVSLATLFF
ncbi:MAG TPA: glycosyl hydrolase 108 family protein [Bacillota bacterium]|nr:glycosyl hydrolase 108 family protein [Bacillota bacterium]